LSCPREGSREGRRPCLEPILPPFGLEAYEAEGPASLPFEATFRENQGVRTIAAGAKSPDN